MVCPYVLTFILATTILSTADLLAGLPTTILHVPACTVIITTCHHTGCKLLPVLRQQQDTTLRKQSSMAVRSLQVVHMVLQISLLLPAVEPTPFKDNTSQPCATTPILIPVCGTQTWISEMMLWALWTWTQMGMSQLAHAGWFWCHCQIIDMCMYT